MIELINIFKQNEIERQEAQTHVNNEMRYLNWFLDLQLDDVYDLLYPNDNDYSRRPDNG